MLTSLYAALVTCFFCKNTLLFQRWTFTVTDIQCLTCQTSSRGKWHLSYRNKRYNNRFLFLAVLNTGMFFCKYAHHRKKGWLHTFPLHHKQDFAGFSFGGLISVSINWISTADNILLHNTLLIRYAGGTRRLQILLWHGLGCPEILRWV